MVSRPTPLPTRLLLGGIAGLVATLPMTMTIRVIHRRLPSRERYPTTPRELIDSTADAMGTKLPEQAARDLTLSAHYGYGAAVGAVIAAAMPRASVPDAAAAGMAVWAVSYLGWIPAAGLLTAATEHPARRNVMMIAAHLIWGGTLALALRELQAERQRIIAAGEDRDVPAW